MAERGVNGASSATLNARFVKCAGCRVNVPKSDLLALGRCTVCGAAYEPPASGGDCVAFASAAASPAPATSAAPAAAAEAPAKPRRRRWVALQSRKGRTYYHNSETGEDRWDKPADFDAEAVDDAFVPFKNDFVKKAVMLEQSKLEASKLGVPVELLAGARAAEGDAPDPLAAMTKQALSRAESVESEATPTPKQPQPRVETVDEEFDDDDGGQQRAADGAAKKGDGACVVM